MKIVFYKNNKSVNFTHLFKEKNMNKKICFIAPSGYGKSRAIKILEKHFKIKNIKLASPLYELQDYFYTFLGTQMKEEQDGELLQFLGSKIRKENPTFILDNFTKKLDNFYDYDGIITNDDCRPPDFQYLKDLGFVFIKINGYKRERQDHTEANTKLSLEWQNELPCDYELDNLGTIEEYQNNLLNLINKILSEEKL